MNRPIYTDAVCLTAVFAAVLTTLAPVSTCQAAEPTTAPATTTEEADALAAKSLADCIRIIKTDKDPSVVLSAFTRACTLDRMNPELNSAYMRRMLLLGKPRAVYMSARILSAQNSDAGLAWAVIGYMMGRSNKYLDALTATARALEFNSDDPSILNNAGQLAAWFDNAPISPKLGDREKRIMDKLKSKFEASKDYKDAYARINSAYVANKSQRAALDAKLTDAQAKYSETHTAELTMRADIKRINSQIVQLNKELDDLEKDLRQNRSRLNVVDDTGRRVYNQRAILDENTRIEKKIDAAKESKEALRKEGTPIVPKIHLATAQGTKLRNDIKACSISLKSIKPTILRELRWDPPSVDGVFTAETTYLPRKIKPATTQPGKVIATSDSETDAAKKLKMAKLYASNKKFQLAREIILELVTKHPKTKAAAQAKELLKSMSPESTIP